MPMSIPKQVAVLSAILVLAVSCGGQDETNRQGNDVQTSKAAPAGPPDRTSLAPLVERAGPAVVNVAVVQPSPTEQNPLLRDPYYRRQMGVPDEALQPRLASGSGVIVDSRRGLVLTNRHVIDGAQSIEVILADRRRFEAQLVGSDEPTDIALLRISGAELPQLPLGNSDEVRVGDFVVAIGNPFGLGQTVTSGIVSALARGLRQEGYESYIQTDAPINPGNSGGPLIAMDGSVIGINSALLGPGANIGIGFAVPSLTARFVMEQLLEHGAVRRGQIGVAVIDTVPSAGGRGPAIQGALIAGVAPGSSAEQAGLREGDVIVAAGGRPVPTASSIRNLVGRTEINERIEMTVRRGETNVAATVQVRPAE